MKKLIALILCAALVLSFAACAGNGGNNSQTDSKPENSQTESGTAAAPDYDTVSEVCRSYHATEMALESPFYGKNAQVILKLGRAQGAAMIAALEFGIPVTEYAPREAKQAITGNGAASKEQVCMMLEKTLGVRLEAHHLDATDALAIALCHHYATSGPLSAVRKGGGSWEKFIQAHPDRVK